ncbi:MAG: hypothetical protein Q8R53_01470 [Nanoarchaeota archaeon]|nr:hypothetical protein [Nanoarchaeota archaeon]
MLEPTERKYDIRLQDFTPFIGHMIYQARNWEESRKEGKKPGPFGKYIATLLGLGVLDVTTGIGSVYVVLQGLEALLQ